MACHAALVKGTDEAWGQLGSPKGLILNGHIAISSEEEKGEDSRENGSGEGGERQVRKVAEEGKVSSKMEPEAGGWGGQGRSRTELQRKGTRLRMPLFLKKKFQ